MWLVRLVVWVVAAGAAAKRRSSKANRAGAMAGASTNRRQRMQQPEQQPGAAALQQANALHAAGRLAEAEREFRRALRQVHTIADAALGRQHRTRGADR